MKKSRKEKENKKNRKSQLIEIGSFLIILICLLTIEITLLSSVKTNKEDNKKIENFFNEQEVINTHNIDEVVNTDEDIKEKPKINYSSEEYIAVLEIPKLNLKRGIYAKDSKLNNVDKNIKILKESSMPDEEKGNVMLAAHSGTAYVSFFKNLPRLMYGEQSIIYYQGRKYNYSLRNSYEIEKNGVAHIIRNNEKSTLTLITCKHNTNKQLIYIFELVNVE